MLVLDMEILISQAGQMPLWINAAFPLLASVMDLQLSVLS